MKSNTLLFCFAILVATTACSFKKKTLIITIENPIGLERTFETVELNKDILKLDDLDIIGIRDIESGKEQITQTIDTDGDGVSDQILFQPKITAHSKRQFEVFYIKKNETINATNYCYSRFVPERTDDYAWENNRVAFRTFGPTAQKMKEDSIPGGTLSSGIDAWLKKVEYPIINKWYKKELETNGTYHEDTGEGLDNFHVGLSRGVGGIAVKADSIYYTSKNFVNYKTITNGPIRSSFYLEYANWDASGKLIKESKIISLDLGSNLSKFTSSIEGTDKISAGLTLHEKDGEITTNSKNGWISYWQPHSNSELGTAIVANKNAFLGYEKYDVEIEDLSNAYAHLKVKDNQVVYYAGFGWKESGQFNSKAEWENYLSLFSKKINNPLKVTFSD